MNVDNTTVAESHPMNSVKIGTPLNWKEWRCLWNENKTYKDRLSMLHWAFKIPTNGLEEEIDRVLFFLQNADRCGVSEVFQLASDVYALTPEDGMSDMWLIRQLLAKKAYGYLCEGFFSLWLEGGHSPFFAFHPEVFPKILWFLRKQTNVDNLAQVYAIPSHYVGIAHRFAEHFCRLAWAISRGPESSSFQVISEYKVNLLEVMENVGVLDCLTEPKHLPDFQTFIGLQAKALATPLVFREGTGIARRCPSDLGEACIAGSKLARVLVLVKAMLQHKGLLTD